MNRWQNWDDTIGRLEKILVATMLSIMILLAFLQIMLRNVFSTGISWGDPLVRYLVLWVGFIGAGLATKDGKHITIEVLSRWFSGHGQQYLHVLSCLVSTLICGLLTFAGWTFIQNEAQMGSTTFLEIPVWIPQVIIPITFALMALRYGFRAFAAFVMIFNPGHSSQNGSHS